MSYTLHMGSGPLLVSMPHVGVDIPTELQDAYVESALHVEDTDWHLERLYAFVRSAGASLIVPKQSRYVIDLNRPPDDTPMYPGASNTELCPTRFFTGEPLYKEGRAPNAQAVALRRSQYWQPYHEALRKELDRIKGEFGYAVLFDAHSIRSELPWLFEGRLPDLNLGTADGKSCAPSLTMKLQGELEAQNQYTQVVNGRFKGGYITRHYGKPEAGFHAVQLEMCQRCYMQEVPPFVYDETRAAQVLPLLQQLIHTVRDWKP